MAPDHGDLPTVVDPIPATPDVDGDPPPGGGSRHGRIPTRRLGPGRAWAVVVAIGFAAPLGYLVVRVLGDPGGLAEVVGDGRLLAPFARTVLLAGLVAVSAAVVGTATAWLVTRTDLPGVRWWRVLLPLPLVIPSFMGTFALVSAFAPGGLLAEALARVGVGAVPPLRGLWGSWLVLTLFTYPYVHLVVASRLNQLPPSLEEAARLFGRRPRQVFTSVVLPQLRSAILAGALLVFLYAASDYGVVELLRYDVLTRVIYASRLADPTLSLTLSLSLGLLALTVAVLERSAAGADRTSGRRSVRGLRVALGRWSVVGVAVPVVVVGLALALPTAVLVGWVVRGATVGASSLLLSDPTALLTPLWATVRVSVLAAVAATVVVLPVGLLATRRRDRVAAGAATVVVAGFALPGLAIALALVFWLAGTPLYRTEVVLVAAYVVHFGAQSLRAAEVAVASVPARIEEASDVLGVSAWRRWRRVELPLMRPGLVAGAGLVLLSVMKELPATLLLAPNGFETLATRIWNAATDAFWTDAAIASLVLLALSGGLTWALVIRRADAL